MFQEYQEYQEYQVCQVCQVFHLYRIRLSTTVALCKREGLPILTGS